MRNLIRLVGWAAAAALSVAVTVAGGPAELYTFDGEPWDRLGWSVDGAGDVDADGYDDIIAGAPSYGAGSARVYSGKDGTELLALFGDSAADRFGISVCGVGDLDGDGHDDVFVGASGDDDGGSDAGSARVFSGQDGTTLHTFHGDTAECEFGNSVGAAGDVNGDGYGDLVVGAPARYDSTDQTGYVQVFSGRNWAILHTFDGGFAGDKFGDDVGGAGDVDADGFDDVIVGASLARHPGVIGYGSAYVFSGRDGSLIRRHDGEGLLGTSVCGATDLDADGHDDYVAGACEENGAFGGTGSAYVYSGDDGTTIFSFHGTHFQERLGRTVRYAGDVDGDGHGDLVITASGDSTHGTKAGRVDVVSGEDGSIISRLYGRQSNDRFGGAAGGAGDVNGDGCADVIVGSIVADYGGTAAGRVWVFARLQPTGTLTIQGGDEFTTATTVGLSLAAQAANATVTDKRVWNAGKSPGAWMPFTSFQQWSLPSTDGTCTVEAEVRDSWGDVSSVLVDTIDLDRAAPVAALTIDGGAACTNSLDVVLGPTATDAVSGVVEMSFRRAGGTWQDWSTYEGSYDWGLLFGDGVKSVDARFRDRAGNVSSPVTASILLDQTAPTATFTVNGGSPYVLRTDELVFETVVDDAGLSSGVADMQVSFDAGGTYSGWYSLRSGPNVAVAWPTVAGLRAVSMVARDAATNESEPAASSVYLIEADPSAPGLGAKCAGVISPVGDVDARAFDLVRGDVFSVDVKSKAETKKAKFVVSLDLVDPTGTRIVVGGHPTGSKKMRIKKFAVPHTGSYLLLVQRHAESPTTTGTYKLTTRVKQAKENKKAVGESGAVPLWLDAVHGSRLKGVVAGDGLTDADVTLVGPQGAVDFEAKTKRGKVTIRTVVLDAGTGRYEIRISGGKSAKCKIQVKLPPKPKGIVHEL